MAVIAGLVGSRGVFCVMLIDLHVVWTSLLDGYVRRTGDAGFVYFGPVVAVWLSQVVTYCVCGVGFTLLDLWHRPELFYRYKIQAQYAYEPAGGSRNPSLLSTLGTVVLAFAAELPALIAFQHVTKSVFGTGVRTTYDAPGWLEIPFAIIVLTLCSEFGFYWTHRLLHAVPFLYKHVHKRHHLFRTPIALAAEAQHPLEMMLCTAFGMTFWPFLFGTHAQVLIIGTVIGTFMSMHDHCGYWLFTNGNQPFFHDWHHEKNDGNYGFLGIMDKLCGTDKSWQDTYEKRKQLVREQGKPKSM